MANIRGSSRYRFVRKDNGEGVTAYGLGSKDAKARAAKRLGLKQSELKLER